MRNNETGYRGYVGSRAYHCGDFPQYVQNMIIRNYCTKHKLTYLLSATEYAMPGCYMILEEVVAAIQSVEGIAFFSVFMLPKSVTARADIYQRVLSQGRSIHFALEDMAIRNEADVQLVEDVLNVSSITKREATHLNPLPA